MVADMIDPFADEDIEGILVAGVGAIPLGHLAAKYLLDTRGIQAIKAVWADKKEPKGQEIVRHGFKRAIRDKRVLLVDGIVNSMFTANELLREAAEVGSEVVGMTAVAANEGVSNTNLKIPKFSKLVEFKYDIWTPEDCAESGPCSQGVKIVDDLGHGKGYKEDHPDYPGGYTSLLTED